MHKRYLVLTALIAALVLAACSFALAEQPSQVNVRDFGAKGDGVTDDTPAFDAAMKAVADQGGTVFIPVGNYLIKTHLNVPSRVTLEGIWKAPARWDGNAGSTLLAVEGEGSETGTPFITLNTCSTIKGLTVFYPNQKPDDIKKYPWCVASGGCDNPSIVDCLLVNPYQAVDFGSKPAGRHYIRGLYGQPLRRGIFVDKCYDIGRIENVHFWPFWTWDEKSGIREWLTKNGEAFIFARTDWEYVFNTFCFGYGIGMRFIKSADGATNGNFLGCGVDAANIAILVEETQKIGVLFTNGEFVGLFGEKPVELIVKDSHTGLVSFSNCAFWGPAYQIARIAGTGTVSFNNCNLLQWYPEKDTAPNIATYGGRLLVNGCTFGQDAPQIALRGDTESAVITGNMFTGTQRITNPAKANTQIGLNVSQKPLVPPKEEKGAIILDDTAGEPGVTLTGGWRFAQNFPNQRIGYMTGTLWAVKGNGEAKAIFRPNVPKSGWYNLYVYFGPDPMHDHATNAPVQIQSADGKSITHVNLRKSKGSWMNIGKFRFAAGRKGSITLSNDADGNVLADAVKLVPVKSK